VRLSIINNNVVLNLLQPHGEIGSENFNGMVEIGGILFRNYLIYWLIEKSLHDVFWLFSKGNFSIRVGGRQIVNASTTTVCTNNEIEFSYSQSGLFFKERPLLFEERQMVTFLIRFLFVVVHLILITLLRKNVLNISWKCLESFGIWRVMYVFGPYSNLTFIC
jgi:hypothetical protein